MVINKKKQHQGEILLINATAEFLKGRPKNYLSEDNVKRVADMYLEWREIGNLSKIIKLDEVIRNDFNLSPSRYVSNNNKEEVIPLDEAAVLLYEAEEEREAVDKELKEMLNKLGLGINPNE